MKRAVVFLILFSMVLHCSVRLGFVTWLYQNRTDISYSLGFVSERPITVCSHAHDQDRAVKIEVAQDNHEKLPVNPFQVREINLFMSMAEIVSMPEPQFLFSEVSNCIYQFADYPDPGHSLFQPPRIKLHS